ncbi:MAG: response regulator transcription factor [Bacteroidetes bacterium]|nr:response regulator transcription factor [Bacteroidota bacterium]
MKLLLVEDNTQLLFDMKEFLNANDFRVETASTLTEAKEKVNMYQYDLLIIDIGLPDGSGFELVKEIKKLKYETGILILTAKDAVGDKVEGLNLGADDYMTKPFHKAELNARIRSILRRNKFNKNDEIIFGDLKIDIAASEVFVKNEKIILTKKEYDLLLYFVQNPNRVITKESIAEYLWGDHADQADNFDFIYNHIKNLRKKISSAGGINYIQAMYGMGYKFSLNQD